MSDRTSTLLGAPPTKWKTREMDQWKAVVFECYKVALVDSADEEEEQAAADLASLAQSESFMALSNADTIGRSLTRMNSTQEGGDRTTADDEDDGLGPGRQKDSEWFLPGDSALRSLNGEGKEPAQVPFKDHAAFMATNDFKYWKDVFRNQSGDRFLSETAQSIVAHICASQASGELRARHGSVPLGKVLRKKREHIVPLSLCLHEFKLWAANWLRTANVFEPATHKEIERRMRYLHLLQRKEVWGPASLPLQSGMRPIAHDQLFRLLLTTREDLGRARDYAFRGYSRRASREKLSRLGNLLKDVLLNEMRVVSGLFSLGSKLNDPKTRALQPTDLLNSWQNQNYVDYTNLANVCLAALAKVPLVRAALMSDYDSDDVKSSLLDLVHWSSHNLFCLPGRGSSSSSSSSSSPRLSSSSAMFLFDEEKEARGLLPEVYRTMAVRVKEELAKHDPHQKPPLSRKKHLSVLKKAFKDDLIIGELMKRMLTCLAALQDLVPSIYVCFELWELAGDGGDFVLYDMLREQCISVMQNTIARVHAVQEASKRLLAFFQKIVQSHQAAAEKKRLKTKKSTYQPSWVSNFHFIKSDALPNSRKTFTQTYLQLWEVAKDAWEYDLTADQLSDKVESLKKVCQNLIGRTTTDQQPEVEPKSASSPRYSGRFKTSSFMDLTANDWLGLAPVMSTSPSSRRKSKSRSSSKRSSKRSSKLKIFSACDSPLPDTTDPSIVKILEMGLPTDEDETNNLSTLIAGDDASDI